MNTGENVLDFTGDWGRSDGGGTVQWKSWTSSLRYSCSQAPFSQPSIHGFSLALRAANSRTSLRLQSPPTFLLPPFSFLLRKFDSSHTEQIYHLFVAWVLASIHALRAPPSISKTILRYFVRDGGFLLHWPRNKFCNTGVWTGCQTK